MKINDLYFAVCFFGVLLMFSTCKKDDRVLLADYYYPSSTLDSGMVYEYQSFRNGQAFEKDYWYYRNIRDGDQLFLVGQNYGSNFFPTQFVREEILPSGSLLREAFLLESPDSTGIQEKVMFDVKQNNVYPFSVKDTLSVFLYEIQFSQMEDVLLNYNIIRNRRYLGQTNYNFQGNAFDCAVFEIKELIEIESEGVQSLEFRGKEYYAKDIGMVYQIKAMGDNVQEMKLEDRYGMEKFEEMAFKQMQELGSRMK